MQKNKIYFPLKKYFSNSFFILLIVSQCFCSNSNQVFEKSDENTQQNEQNEQVGQAEQNISQLTLDTIESDQIIIKLAQNVKRNSSGTQETLELLLNNNNLTLVNSNAARGIIVAKRNDSRKSLQDIIENINKSSIIDYVESDTILSIGKTPNDPGLIKQWALQQKNSFDISALQAWEHTTGSANVVVAVIDTGIDYTHEDLKDNMWTNNGEIPENGIDDDGNGYIDDIYGIDTVNNDSDPMDDESHGTHCAGIIGAAGNNAIGITGTCWNVKLMPLKFLDSEGYGYSSKAIICIDYAIQMGAHIMSNSWGGGSYNLSLYNAIQRAQNAGILFVAASGNRSENTDLNPHYPSSYSNYNIISVASLSSNDSLSYFSNFGILSVDLAAPGDQIYSTLPGNRYGNLSGTSMATPYVAGIAALLKSNDFSLTFNGLKEIILDTSVKRDYLTEKIVSGGAINAYYSVINDTAPTITILELGNTSIVKGIVPIKAEADDDNGIEKIQVYAGDVLVGEDTESPYQVDWKTTLFDDQTNHNITAVAYDNIGRQSSAEVRVKVNNSDKPGVYIYSPLPGSICSGKTLIEFNLKSGSSITNFELYIDDILMDNNMESPYNFLWDTCEYINGQHEITIKAYSIDGSFNEDRIELLSENISLQEREALIALYNNTNGDLWENKSNWKKDDGSFNDRGTEKTWYGVTVQNGQVTGIHLHSNNLDGMIPGAIGNLINTREIHLSSNRLSGLLPASIGYCTDLEFLSISRNNISGSIPHEIGNCINLEYLYLYNNNFSGTIPPELGNLNKLEFLHLEYNSLEGTVIDELKTLTNLKRISVNMNQLHGKIPGYFINFNQLYDHASDFRYNALYSEDQALTDFLNQKQIGNEWMDTQTTAPEDIMVSSNDQNEIILNWSPILYQNEKGAYRVLYSRDKEGPYNLLGVIPDKNKNNYTTTSLLIENDYFFIMQTVSEYRDGYPDEIMSEFSKEIKYGSTEIKIIQPVHLSENRYDVSILADVLGSTEISNVTFYLDDAVLHTDMEAPYEFVWDTFLIPNRTYSIKAIAAESTGKHVYDEITVNINNPGLKFLSPYHGQSLDGMTPVKIDISSYAAIQKIDFYINETLAHSDAEAPFGFSWDTLSLPNETYIIKAVAAELTGDQTDSEITVTVNNPDTISPQINVDSPGDGEELRGTIHISFHSTDNSGLVKYERAYVYDSAWNMINDHIKDDGIPSVFEWDTTKNEDGEYTIVYVAEDHTGNYLRLDHTVFIDNNSELPVELVFNLSGQDQPVHGVIPIQIDVIGSSEVNKLYLYIDNTLVHIDESAPYEYTWDTVSTSNETHIIKAVAAGLKGKRKISEIAVSVDNRDTISPQIFVNSPGNGEILNGIISISFYANDNSDNIHYMRASIYDNTWSRVKYFSTYNEASVVYEWDTTEFLNGAYTIVFVVYDHSNNPARMDYNVTIDN